MVEALSSPLYMVCHLRLTASLVYGVATEMCLYDTVLRVILTLLVGASYMIVYRLMVNKDLNTLHIR